MPLSQLLKPTVVPRSQVAHLNPILYDDGRAVNEFFAPGTEYFGRQVVPPDNKWSDGTRSFMAPISHYHLLQTESFHVESGEGLWYLRDKTIYLKAGDNITIPRFVAHRFENVPGSTQPLSILYRYDAQRYEMERRFFSNTLTYLDDCRVAGVSPSVLQLCIFLSDCWMPGDFLWVPGGEHVRCLVNALFMWVMAAIGRVVFGYKGAYSEYYVPKVGGEYFKSSSKKVT
ncbi:hypothetical protein LA080_015638 [Diaporthe eres]|nr:hypothetical protein LA080_015638 [Diaporthe eres]